MKNMKISTKLIVSFLTITAFSVALACVGIFASVFINSNYTYLLEGPVDRQDYLTDMRLQFTMMRYRAANYAMESNNPDIITGTLTPQFQSAYSAFTTALNAYEKSNSEDTRRDAQTISQNNANAESLGKLVDDFRLVADNVRSIALTGDFDAATTALRNSISLANEINALLDNMVTPATEYVHSESDAMDGAAVTLIITQIVMAAICMILSVILALYISGLIGKPIRFMNNILMRIGTKGDLRFTDAEYKQIEDYATARDEVGESVNMLLAMVRRLVSVGDALEMAADGDLTIDLTPISDSDTMGLALKKMTEQLNVMLGEVNSSADQVSTGSKQVADGAQALAQGSTEQAATVQQLSSAISEIASTTRTNSDMAGRAASLADVIMRNAEKGSRQMDEMMQAVSEITHASQSIGRVIKAIDDIAFQTNILALNASVEAARAGQHGKGFAVVAGEVRNLAAKSAEAAKNTSGLIANSIEKSELGARIAEETAASLSEIVSGISESNQLVADIARLSMDQLEGITQINNGIDQVAQVVQQNSATAEQSAAASEEISGQSSLLNELMKRFKIKNGGSRSSRAMPSYTRSSYAQDSEYANSYEKY